MPAIAASPGRRPTPESRIAAARRATRASRRARRRTWSDVRATVSLGDASDSADGVGDGRLDGVRTVGGHGPAYREAVLAGLGVQRRPVGDTAGAVGDPEAGDRVEA